MPSTPPDDDDDREKLDELPPQVIAELEEIFAVGDDTEFGREVVRMLARQRAKAERSVSTPLDPTLDVLVEGVLDARENYESPAHRAARELVGDPPPTGPAFYQFGRFQAFDVQEGGMGVVLKAHDPTLDRVVAIKLWKRKGRQAREALRAEAKTLAQLSHLNVVRIYETDVWNGRVFFVMEWIEGVDGHAWLFEGDPPTWQQVRDVYIEAGKGLAAAHAAGIQHRDFKPSNILIGDDGRVVIADFGVAESIHTIAAYRKPGRIVGTPSYMAPERLRGQLGDARSDQFSFCASLWRALHGIRPFEGGTNDELLAAIEAGEIQTGDWTKNVPPWMSRIARRGLAEDPELRFADMHELIEALRAGPPPDESQAEEAPGDGAAEPEDRGLLNTPEVEQRDVPEAVEAVVEDPAPDERAPVRMPPTPETKTLNPWMLMSFGLMGVVVGVVVALVLIVLRQTPQTPVSDRSRAHGLLTRTISPSNDAKSTQMCVLSEPADSQVEVDRVLREVCRLIQLDLFDAADILWAREREVRQRDDDSNLGIDTLTVARTFVTRAEALEHTDRSASSTAAQCGFRWALAAAVELGQNDPEVTGILERADVLLIRDASSAH